LCRLSGRRRPVLQPHRVVVPAPQTGRVSDPRVDRLFGEPVSLEIIRATAPEVDEELRPHLDAGLGDEPLGVRADGASQQLTPKLSPLLHVAVHSCASL
jgi:hypothetical protein